MICISNILFVTVAAFYFHVCHLPFVNGHAAMVGCQTPVALSGHGGVLVPSTPGAGTVRLARGGLSLDCGSKLNAGESLVAVVAGTSGLT